MREKVLLQVFLMNEFMVQAQMVGAKVQAALTAAVYEKVRKDLRFTFFRVH